MSNGSDLERDNLLDTTYFPRIGGRIAHYYGDHTRKMFLAVAVGFLISAPFLTGVLSTIAPLQILFSPLLIGLSALTNPRNQLIMIGNAALAGVGIVVFELISIALFRQDYVWASIAYAIVALIYVFALYFSLKTLRAMRLGIIGKRDLPGEFMEEKYEEAKAKETR